MQDGNVLHAFLLQTMLLGVLCHVVQLKSRRWQDAVRQVQYL